MFIIASALVHGIFRGENIDVFGSDRSPRCQDVVHPSVRLSVRPSVRDIMQENSENEF